MIRRRVRIVHRAITVSDHMGFYDSRYSDVFIYWSDEEGEHCSYSKINGHVTMGKVGEDTMWEAFKIRRRSW